MFDIARNDKDYTLNKTVLNLCNKNIKYYTKHDLKRAVEFRSLYKKALLFAAPVDFDCYLIYLEFNRHAKDKFYLPRRRVLLPVVRAMQKLVDDELDELFLSMPPRVGKTTLALMFMSWVMGRNPDGSNLYSGFSDTIMDAFYKGVLEIITDPVTYLWSDVFPNAHIASTNAKLKTLDIHISKRYPSITCRSLYGTLNGSCDCNSILIGDDLIGGIEEALNPDRMNGAWSRVDNNLLTRAKEKAKILWIGTRWSIIDPIGKRLDMLREDEHFKNLRYEVVNLPALNDEDESNFQYLYGVGFSTDYYLRRRASFENNDDIASWLAQYMGEPIERAGTLFTPDNMNFYNGVLPDGEPDRVFAFCDPSFGGGDYTSMPIACQYGERIYIPDVVFNKGDKRITQPLVVDKIIKNGVRTVKFERNTGGEDYAMAVSKLLDQRGYNCNIETAYAPSNKAKEIRIFDRSPEIHDCYFLQSGIRSPEYEQFMQNIFKFHIEGKNRNDDAPDSMAGLMSMKDLLLSCNLRITKRIF